jgi:membrane-associated phospholipid phosphatase
MKSKLYPEEIIVFIFSILVLSFQLRYEPSSVIPLLAAFIVFFIFVIITKRRDKGFIVFLRSYLHIPYYGIIFSAFQSFLHKLNPNDYDFFLAKADLAVFGFDITKWFEKFNSHLITDILTLTYFSYYILPSLTAVVIYFYKKNDRSLSDLRKYILAAVIAWYSAFIWYLIIPAAGPDIAFPQNYTTELKGSLSFVNYYLNSVHTYLSTAYVRNTFPSLHFGIILIINYFAFKKSKLYFFLLTLPLGTGLAIATLYLRQHYLIDLLGSVLVAVYSIWMANKWLMEKKTGL